MSLENSAHKTIVVIVTYNAMPWIQSCLDSCKQYPVMIVDNNSADGTVAYIQENFPQVYVMPQKENMGFGQANNLGIKYALNKGADYVFLLNQDAYLQEGCIEKLVVTHIKNPSFGILSPIHLNGTGDQLDGKFTIYVSYHRNAQFYSDFVLEKPKKEIYEVPFVNAAGWLLSKKIIETVGGFDPIFFHYGEDDNYCQRANYHNFKIGIVPIAFLQHDREGRAVRKIERGTQAYFKELERSFKMKYANPNNDIISELEQLLKKRKRTKLKAFLKMRFSEVDFLTREIALLTQLIPEIKDSLSKNKRAGSTYV